MKNTKDKIKISITAASLIIITVFCFIIPLRPQVSEAENRALAVFPEFSPASLADGSYFEGISLWFSDTVPFRDKLIAVNALIQNFLGTDTAAKGFNEGVKGDEIPELPPVIPTLPEETTAEETSGADGITEETTAEETTAEETTSSAAQAGNSEKLGSILISDNAGYEYYNFVQDSAINYAAAINSAWQKFGSMADIYVMIPPLSTDIVLDPAVRQKLSVSDQRQASAYILSCILPEVKKCDIFDNLYNKRNEYIYFRTDHHWTALGAYYAYQGFCEKKGIAPTPLEDMETLRFPGFLGSFYRDSMNSPALGGTPDEVTAYLPPCGTVMTVTDREGKISSKPVIYNESNAAAGNKYGTFLCGDNPYSVIENKSRDSGESILVIKESFGNALVPFLIPHYKYVYVVDYRYYNQGIGGLIQQKDIDDILFINNISMTRSKNLISLLTGIIK